MSKICLCLSSSTVEGMTASLNACPVDISMVELRIDALDQIEEGKLEALMSLLKGRGIDVVWTVRRREEAGAFDGDEGERLRLLHWGDVLGATYVDVELRSDLALKLRLTQAQKILSYHDFESCPERPEEIVREMVEKGADVAKVAFKVESSRECVKVLALYDGHWPCPLVAIAMGEYGSPSRLFPAKLGMPWTYAALPDEETAPGQFDVEVLNDLYRYESISESTKCFAVLGNPVAHSLSPEIHNQHYLDHGVDACYGKIRVDDMDAFYEMAKVLRLDGASVTVPHKEDLVRWMEEGTVLKTIGAANTIIREGDHWRVENTDIEAAMTAIELQLPDVDLKPRVLLLGAGGVSRSLAHGMKAREWKVTVTNRSTHKAEALADEIGGEWMHWDDRCAHGFDVVVNGTSLGMSPRDEETPLEFEGGHTGLVVFDTVYTPEYTLLLRLAKEAGATVVTGREMFFRQAALQHAHWFGGMPPWESMEKILSSL